MPMEKQNQTHEIPTGKKLDSRNTHGKKFWIHEILTKRNFGPTKYPGEKISDPRNTTRKILDPMKI